MVLVPLSRGLLYSMGPFFAHPLKPAANMLFGDTYAMAYKHFRRDHTVSFPVVSVLLPYHIRISDVPLNTEQATRAHGYRWW